MKIPNYDTYSIKTHDKRVVPFLPEDFRMLICGQSGCGKTNTLVHMLRNPLIDYDEAYIYTPNQHQDKIRDLVKFMNGISRKVGYDVLSVMGEDDIKDTCEYPHNNRKIVVFDDLINAPERVQGRIANGYTNGRHNKISCIYLSQSYYDVPCKLRQNCSHMILYPPNSKTHLNLISKENGIAPEAFSKLKPFEFIFLDKSKKEYRKNFDEQI